MKATGRAKQRQLILAERRQQAARLYMQGLSYEQIGDRLGVHKSQISRDLAKVRQEWRESADRATGEWVAQELARLEAIEAEAWAAWKRSTQDRQTVTKETGPRGGAMVTVKTTTRTDGQAGDAALLAKVLDCVKQRREMLGLDVPKRTEVSGPDGGPIPVTRVEELTDEQLLRIAARGSQRVTAEAACEVESSELHDLHEG